MKPTNHTYNIYYDEEADFLEVFFGSPAKCYAEEIKEGVFIRKDEKTHEVKSIGILSFKKRPEILKELLHRVNLKLPIKVKVGS